MSMLLWTGLQRKLVYAATFIAFGYMLLWLSTGEDGPAPEELLVKTFRKLKRGIRDEFEG